MQILKTTVRFPPGENPYGEGWYSGWVQSRDSHVINSSPSMRRWIGAKIGDVVAWAYFIGGHECWSSEFIDEER